jgi:hypothetical protein
MQFTPADLISLEFGKISYPGIYSKLLNVISSCQVFQKDYIYISRFFKFTGTLVDLRTRNVFVK